MALLSVYDYLSGSGILGAGQQYGAPSVSYDAPVGDPGLSLAGYRNATGRNVAATDQGYRDWVTANIPQSWFDSQNAARDVPGGGGIGIRFLPNGMVDVPDKSLGSNLAKGWDFKDAAGGLALLAAPVAGMLGAFGGAAGAGAGAAGAADSAMAAGAMGGAAGPSFGGLTALEAAGGAAAAGGGAAGGGWDYGEFLQSVGVDPASTQFSGGTMSNAEIMSQIGGSGLSPDIVSQAQQALKAGNSAKSIADALGISEGAVSLLGKLGASALGVFGANQQQDSQQRLAAQFAEYGAPYRARLAESYADPSAFLKNSPDINAAVQQGTDATARSLSTQGNPAGSGHALQELQNYATTGLYGRLGQERDRLAGFGGLTAYNQAAPQAATNAVNSEGNALNAVGAGINSIMQPQKTTYQTMMEFFKQPGLA